jgi:5-methyltetrahydrofolate--homocysteine methyltransferase
MNPVRPQEMEAIRAANFLMNNDESGAAWIKHCKTMEAVKDGTTFAEAAAISAKSSTGGRRGGGRRRREG